MTSLCRVLGSVVAAALPLSAQESAALLDAPLSVFDSRTVFGSVLDFNGDGFQDAISYNKSTGSIGWRAQRNDGTGVFVPGTSSSTSADGPHSSYRLATWDLDGDAFDDFSFLVPANTDDDGFFHVYRATGGGFTKHEGLSLSAGPAHAAIADFDGDGLPDRAFMGSPTLLRIDVVTPDGSGGWHHGIHTLGISPAVDALAVIDCNGDATPDLYLNQGTQGSFVPVLGGVPQAPISVPHGVASPMPMTIPGDVDGDGDEDLALFAMTNYRIHRRTGPSSWQLEPLRVGGPAAKLADVDLDGDLDGICCGGGGTYPYYFDFPSTFRIALNDGSGSFAPAFTFPGAGSHEIAGAADIDHDGDVDLLAGHCVYYSRQPLVAPPQVALDVAQSARSIVDLERDGDPDFTPGTVPFRRNLGDGRALALAQLHGAPPPAGQRFVGPGVPGDWDGDGDSDLVVRMENASSGAFVSMRLLLNVGGGSYADRGDASLVNVFPPTVAGSPPENTFACDLDLDGDLDLVTFRRDFSDYAAHRFWTWMNDGLGHFTEGWKTNMGWPLALGSFWGSAYPDVILVTGYGEDAQVHVGLGNGVFQTNSVLDLILGNYVGPASLAIADFDGDGDEDIVGALAGGGAESEHAYFIPSVNGNLSVADQELLLELDAGTSLGEPPPRIALAGDVNGDGLTDALLSSPDHDRPAVAILLRRADNTGWEPPVRHVVYPQHPETPSYVDAVPGALVDVDGDGDDDLVTGSIWRSVGHSMPESGARRQNEAGTPDVHGFHATLGASGSFRPGEAAKIRLTGAPGGAAGELVVCNLPSAPMGGPVGDGGGSETVLLSFTTSGPPGVPGVGAWTLSFTVPPYVAGRTKTYFARIDDPSAPGATVRTNKLAISYGQ